MSLFVDISKRLGDFNLNVKFETDGGFTSLFGLSGSGKSLTLKCIAGVMTPDEGVIILNGRVLFDSKKRINIKPQKRNIGYLPQDFSLFPNMTVKENIATGLHSLPKKQRDVIVQEYLSKYKLSDVADLRSHQISGGEKQRTALARALATKPEVILLDEPFSALDTQLKDTLELDLVDTLRDYDGNVLFVSHNNDEVYRLSDNVCVFDGGTCETIKPTKDVFLTPSNRVEAVLVGVDNISDCHENSEGKYKTNFGITLEADSEIESIGFSCDAIRHSKDADIVFDATIHHIYTDTNGTYLMLKVHDAVKPIKMRVDNCRFSLSDKITIGLNYRDILFFK